MTYIDEMIKELCPDGVEWKELGEVCEVNKGKQLNKTLLTADGEYPAYNGGKTYSGRTDSYNVEANTIIVSQGGASAGFVNFVETRFWANAHCYYLLPDMAVVDNRYLYHFLKMNQNYLMEFQHGAGIPALKSDKLTKLKMPIPPLEIQNEIVKILDKFTDYVTELTAELTFRQKQYSYFRDKLLSFDDESMGGANNKVYTVQWKTLGEVANFRRGSFPQPYTDMSFYGGEDAQPFVQVVDVADEGFRLNTKTKKTISQKAIPKSVFVPKGTVIVTLQGTLGRVAVTQYNAYVDRTLAIFDGYKQEVDKRYFAHQLKFIFDREKEFARGSTLKTITKEEFSKFKIPLPSLAIQSRIVEVLDNFDTVCNDLNIGLPKEIELRQKQYEFFRDQLLTFTAEGVYTDSTVQYRQDLIRLLTWVFGPIRVELGAVCNLVRGNGLQKKDFVDSGFPCIHYGQIYTHYGLATDQTKSFVSPELAQKLKKASYGDVIVATTSENSEDVGKSLVWLGQTEACIGGHSCLLKSEQLGKYLVYYMQTTDFQRQKEKMLVGTKVIELYPKNLARIQIILPSLEEQNHIISILDRFNTLTTNLVQGLPAEIEQRQKQYAYWRDRLLNFP